MMAQTKGQTIESRGVWDQGVASLQTQPLFEGSRKRGIRFKVAQTCESGVTPQLCCLAQLARSRLLAKL